MEGAGGTFVSLLDEPSRVALADVGRVRSYRRGAVLLLEGDHSDHVFVIREGRVKVVATTTGGQELLLAVRGPGELIGELAALTHGSEARSASVMALDPIVAQVIAGVDFEAFLEQHPRVLMIVMRKLMERLRDADRRRVEFGSQHTMGRVAGYLPRWPSATAADRRRHRDRRGAVAGGAGRLHRGVAGVGGPGPHDVAPPRCHHHRAPVGRGPRPRRPAHLPRLRRQGRKLRTDAISRLSGADRT